jgi:site-specific DNA-methyltransferase (cytosine-N4-specific)
LLHAFSRIIHDIRRLQGDPLTPSKQVLYKGSSLEILPTLAAEQFNAVITSPPYANRSDYTRTYALELAFMGVDGEIFDLRQRLLSCTVENRSKSNSLESYYQLIGARERYLSASTIARSNESLIEVSAALKERHSRGEINNSGVLPMIDQYFEEMTMVFYELFRTCRSGAKVAFVNDNVRYAGEIIPVDTISTSIAEAIGFMPEAIYVLPQKKGNSSQQMSRYGRVPLRKSITIWRKP